MGTRRRLCRPLGVDRYIGVYRSCCGKGASRAAGSGVPVGKNITRPGRVGREIRRANGGRGRAYRSGIQCLAGVIITVEAYRMGKGP
jgi:hypothetical protein